MNVATTTDDYEVGYDIPAAIGMTEADILTPCLIVDLDALERNIATMQARANSMGVRLRAHGKMHKAAAVAHMQVAAGATGICAQKVSEAEAFARAGITDILVTNQVRNPAMIDRLARLATQARIIVCVDDVTNVAELSQPATRHSTTVECLVEIDCGAGRCGVTSTDEVVAIAQAIDNAPGLTFTGIQAYQGAVQHIDEYATRQILIDAAVAQVSDAIDGLKAHGFVCDIVGGGGTGSYAFEGNSGVYNELQCGSYAFMDAAYGRILDQNGKRIDDGEWENALFLLTTVMSHVKKDQAVCDAGLKVQSVDSGLPVVYGRTDVTYSKCSDEHGVIEDPNGQLAVGDRLRLVPGHCDPTCNLHDWYVGVRNGVVEQLMPVTARGKTF